MIMSDYLSLEFVCQGFDSLVDAKKIHTIDYLFLW